MNLEFNTPTSTEWVKWLAKEEARKREVYRISPQQLISDYRREEQISRGYHGREILELLQNAGDAARLSGSPGKIRISVTRHGLVIGNTGRPFDMGGVESLQTANLSPKHKSDGLLIGDKGLGFRAVLNWTQSPLISSGELGLAFLPSYALNIIDRLAAESSDLAQRIAEEHEISGDLIAPRLAFPQWVPDWSIHDWPDDDGLRKIVFECQLLRNEGFETVMGMPFFNKGAYAQAVAQVFELKPEFLLLVDSIAELEIQVSEHSSTVWSCIQSNGRALIQVGETIQSSWTVSTYEGEVPQTLVEKPDNKKNRFQISLAIPDSNNAIPGWLFCYFPTEVDVPLPLLVHATVELDETRKHVINSLANQYILKTVAERIAELAEQQLNREGADPWDGCRLVSPTGAWGTELMKFGVPTTLKEAAKKKKIIPVLGGGHLDGFQAKLPPSKDSTWWSAQLFPEMVAVVHNQEQQFAQRLDVAKFSSTELLSRILDNDHLTVEERARAIVGFIKCKEKPSSEKICCLLCDESETSLPPDTKSMLQSTGELPSLPSWATIRFLHKRLRQQLADLLQTTDNHDLQHQLRAFGVSEYSFETVVNSVISESDIQVRSQPDNESAIRQETIKFLWVIHHGAGRNTAFPSDTTVKLPNQIGGWTDSKQLYLGEGYGNEGKVLQNIYSWAKYKLVANIDNLGLDLSTEIELVKRFLLWLGVACWPREIELKNYESEYLDDLKANLRYPVDFDNHSFSSPDELYECEITGILTVDSLIEILRKVAPEVVLAWLALDPRATAWTRLADKRGTLSARPAGKRKKRSYNGKLLSYIHWQISSFPWLATRDGSYQAPRQCLYGDHDLQALFPSPKMPKQSLFDQYGVSGRLDDGIRNAGVMFDLAHLRRDELYRLLLDAPDRSPDGKTCVELCRRIVSHEDYPAGPVGPYQKRFVQEGMMWGSKNGTSDFFRVTDLWYVDKEGFPPALKAKLSVADLPKLIDNQKVQALFGVKP